MKNLSEFLIEMAKWKKMVSTGKISTQGIRRLRKAGNIRPEKEEIGRLKKATDTILKKTNSEKVPFNTRNMFKAGYAQHTGKEIEKPKGKIISKISNIAKKIDDKVSERSVKKNPLSSHYTIPGKQGMFRFSSHGKNIVTSPTRKQLSAAKKSGKQGAKAGAATGDYHEALETLAVKKAQKGKNLVPIITKGRIATKGAHFDQSVLRGERKVTDYQRHAYKGKGLGTSAEELDKYRRKNVDKYGVSERQKEQMKRRQLEKLNKRN